MHMGMGLELVVYRTVRTVTCLPIFKCNYLRLEESLPSIVYRSGLYVNFTN